MILGPKNCFKKSLESKFSTKIFLRGEHLKNESKNINF